MADAGMYDLRLHHDQVLVPVLFKHWRLQQLSGLTPEAEVARDRLIAFVAKVDRAASWFEESRARRLGLDYLKGRKAVMETANGIAAAYRIKLDTVRIGDLTVNNVDAVVMEGDSLPVALLGMSFLNRMDIRREGQIMTLTKRY